MTRYSNQMKLGNVGERTNNYEINEGLVHTESIGRPTWWFKGSVFSTRTHQEHRLSILNYRIAAQSEKILSQRIKRIKSYISLLSEWFPLSLLDELGKDILLNKDSLRKDKTLFLYFLGAIEARLRERHLTIRWYVLQEISQSVGQKIRKKDFYKFLYDIKRHKKGKMPNSLYIVQHIAIEAVQKADLPIQKKKKTIQQIIKVIKILESKQFVCKDPELAAFALKRILLEETGEQSEVPHNQRKMTARITYRLKNYLLEN